MNKKTLKVVAWISLLLMVSSVVAMVIAYLVR